MKALLGLSFFWSCIFLMTLPAIAQGGACARRSGVGLAKKAAGAIVLRVPKYTPLTLTGQSKSGWTQVSDFQNEKFWVRSRDLRDDWNCVVVKAHRIQTRTGPSSRSPAAALGKLERYTPLLDLGGEDGWTEVQDSRGEKAWVPIDDLWRPRRKVRMSFGN